VYANTTKKKVERVFQIIEPLAKTCRNRILFRSAKSLASGFKTPQLKTARDILILIISTQKELEDILSFQKVLIGCQTLMVLPDRKKETNVDAHKLHPRFIAYLDSDLSELYLVLERIVHQERSTGGNKSFMFSGESLQEA
jgi:hypothetical protein